MPTDDAEKVHIMVAKDTLDCFYKCKAKIDNSAMTDSDFLQIVLGHFDTCPMDSRFSLPNGINCYTEHVCPECDFVAENLSEMSSHFDSRHSVEASFSCTCGSSYEHMPDFLRHYIECPIAATDLQDPGRNKRSDSPTRLKKSIHENNEEKSIETNPQNFQSSRKDLTIVPINGPSNEKPFGCPHCQKGFKSKSLLEQHMHLHYPPRYKCRWCGKVYRWPPVYYHHMRICKKMQSLKQTGHADIDKVSTHDEDIYEENIKESSPDQHCSQNNQSPPEYMLNNKRNSPLDKKTSFPCPIPSSETTVSSNSSDCPAFKPINAQSSKEDIDSPNTNVKLEDSPLYTSSLTFNSKVSCIASGQAKSFTCNICSKEFTSKLSLKQHVDGKHRTEGKYVCQLCGKRYRWGASFYYHRRTCIFPSIMDFSTNPEVPSLPQHVSQPSA